MYKFRIRVKDIITKISQTSLKISLMDIIWITLPPTHIPEYGGESMDHNYHDRLNKSRYYNSQLILSIEIKQNNSEKKIR
jgi:hypothetical protein